MNTDKIAKLEQKKAELERQKKEIEAKIRAVKSKELHKKRKLETHYKILLGSFWLNEIVMTKKNGMDINTDFPKLRKFINNDEKFELIQRFIIENLENK